MADQVITVHVADWEIECCAPPPGVGDVVSWPLLLHVPDPPVGTPRRWTVERREQDSFVVDGPVVAHWPPHSGPAPEPGPVEVAGELLAALHGTAAPAEHPLVTGTVRRVCVESHEFELIGKRLHPAPGSARYREVERSPRWFEHHGPRQDTGVVCELVVADGPS